MKIIPLLFALLLIGMYAAPVMAADPSNELTDPISYMYKWFGGKRVTTIDDSTFGNVTNIFNNSGNLSTISTYTNFYNIYQSEMNQTPGPQGEPGEPAAIYVNFTFQRESGEDAYVADVGTTPYEAELDFYIPRGYNGSIGETGPQGIPGLANMTPGPQGETGPQGIPGLANMTPGPQGETGPQGIPGLANMTPGPQGDPGNAATIGVNNTVTGAPGTSATVTNIGTAYAALFDFVIPRGEKGDKGDTGNTGPTGPMNQTANMTSGPPGEPGADATIEDAYPVGSIYISTVSTNPNTLFGFGTWAAFATGRVLVGIDAGNAMFNSVEETGGATTNQTSAHIGTAVTTHSTSAVKSGTGVSAVLNGAHTVTQPSAHTEQNIMDPYIVVYMWERTA